MIPVPGDRVRVTGVMPDDPAPMPVGSEGTVEYTLRMCGGLEQIHVTWDNGRTLFLLSSDPFEIISRK